MKNLGCEPLLKWAGGKRRLLKDILSFAPDSFEHYYEPFLGGGATFFSLQPPSATLSDTNPDLMEMYLQLRDNVNAVIRCLRTMPNTDKDYYIVRSTCPRSPSARAARLIYLCALSFNGIYRQNLKGEFNVPYGYKTHMDPFDEHRLRNIAEVLQGRTIVSGDFEGVVSKAKSGDFIYFDPPYTVAHGNNGFVKYNAKIFSWADQRRLAQVAFRLKKKGCNVLVSNADHPSIHKLYQKFNVHIVERHSIMAASSEYRRHVKECLFY
jgi:DNA adenine methylase